jgi:cell division transport system permease protein
MTSRKEENVLKGRIRGAYITSLMSISLVLLMLGIVGLLVLNVNSLSVYIKENMRFSLIIHENVKDADIRKFQKTLDSYSYIKSTEYITSDEAAAMLEEELGENFLETLGYNPLSPTINVYLIADYANPDSIKMVEQEFLSHSDIVQEVSYQQNLVQLINDNVSKISLTLLIFSIILFIISFALLNNTIRLMIYSKRFIINTMKLVGATRSFIRKPFLISGIIQGIISAFIAIICLGIMIHFANEELKEIITLIDYKTIGLLFIIVLILGIVLSLISTYFAVNKYLRIKSSNLYY